MGPADKSLNSDRGNKDFGYVHRSDGRVSTQHECPNGGCPYTKTVFEPPAEARGVVARAMMYMDVRYDGDGRSQTPDLQLVTHVTGFGQEAKSGKFGKLCDLLDWHYRYPVTDDERKRNDRAYHHQGNRNPFVDHPEYVAIVFGAECPSVTSEGSATTPGETGTTAGHREL